jgi:hypothetical protein
MVYYRRSKTQKKSTSTKSCTRQFTKKYKSRPSPPYPANQCKNHIKIGNDRHKYQSISNRNGIYTWKKI